MAYKYKLENDGNYMFCMIYGRYDTDNNSNQNLLF